jgi:Tfp pilus assembly protein PilE
MGSIIGTPPPDNPQPPQQPPYQQPPYQQQPPQYQAPYQPPPSSGSGVKTAILFIAVIALIAATAYQYYSMSQMKADLVAQMSDLRDSVAKQIDRQTEYSNTSSQTANKKVAELKGQVDEARRQASQLAGQAKVDADKHADELADRLQKAQDQQSAKVTAVANDVTQVRDQATVTQSKVGEVTTEVGNLKTDQVATKEQLEKTAASLKSTIGDLGIQSDRVATNDKEIGALRALGERNIVQFRLAKAKNAEKVGDVQVRLTSADPKKNKYTVVLIADDKTVEKKDKSINEPVQFYLSRAAQPYELVVNEIRKDMIVGYVSAPKVQQSRTKN